MISRVPKWVAQLVKGNLLKPMKVIDIQNLSSVVKKIKFHGDISSMDFLPGSANAILVGNGELRNYTVSKYNYSRNEFEIIFYLNRVGTGSSFVTSLEIDDWIYMDNPRGKTCYEESLTNKLFFGDETSFGLAYLLVSLFKKNKQQYKLFFELDETNKYIPEKLKLDNYQVFKKGEFHSGELQNILEISSDTLQNTQFILTGNAKSVQNIRRKIKENGLRFKIYAKGYWLKGKKGF